MKVLLLSHSPDDPNAGASRVYHILADGLTARGHEVTLLHLESMGLPAHPLARKLAEKLVLPRYVEKTGRGLAALADQDVVMVSSGQGYRLFQQIAALPGRRPVTVNHLHGLAIYDDLAARTLSWLGFWPVSASYRYVTGSRAPAWDMAGVHAADLSVVQNFRDESYVGTLAPDAGVRYIPPCLHPDLLEASTSVAPIEARGNRILWFGSWERRKGAFLVAPVLEQVAERIPDVEMVIGGTGLPAAEILERFPPGLRSRVTVLPRISIEQQIAEFNAASAFFFPSFSEGFGLAVIEAMAFGCCGVSTNTGGFIADYALDRVHAMVAYPSVKHMALALTEILQDPDLKARVSAEGRSLARTFTAERMVDAYDELFREVAGGAAAG